MRLLYILLLISCFAGIFALPAWGAAANYYVDYTKTSGDSTGVDTLNAYLSIIRAVEAVHVPGDTIWVRDTHVEVLDEVADVLSDGSSTAPIVLMGDEDSRIWAASTSSVEITCGANYLYWYTDDYWHLSDVNFSGMSVQGVYINASDGVKIEDCVFDEPVASADYGIWGRNCAFTIDSCVFDGNVVGSPGADNGQGVYTSSCVCRLIDCTFDDLMRGVSVTGGAIVYAINCEFGQTETNTSDAWAYAGSGVLSILSGKMNSNSLLDVSSTNPLGVCASRFYADASNRPMAYTKYGSWNSTTDYTTVHSGGADYSLKVMTNVAAAGMYAPIKVAELAVHADSLETRDYTLSARRNTGWNPAPTAAQFYLEATYIASSVSTATVVSTQVLTNADTWYDLTAASVTPVHKGPVMITLWLKTTVTGGEPVGALYIDPRLVATGETYHETFLWGTPDLAFLYTEEEDEAAYDVLYQLRHHMQIKGGGKTWQRP